MAYSSSDDRGWPVDFSTCSPFLLVLREFFFLFFREPPKCLNVRKGDLTWPIREDGSGSFCLLIRWQLLPMPNSPSRRSAERRCALVTLRQRQKATTTNDRKKIERQQRYNGKKEPSATTPSTGKRIVSSDSIRGTGIIRGTD
jgi:hypothetical protein